MISRMYELSLPTIPMKTWVPDSQVGWDNSAQRHWLNIMLEATVATLEIWGGGAPGRSTLPQNMSRG